MQQREVSIVEMRSALCLDLDGVNKYYLKKILKEFEVDAYVDTKVIEILDDGVVVENSQGQFTLPAETVVLALGYKPNNGLTEELKEIHENVITIGGALKTGNALVAIKEGFDVGINL